MSEVLDAVKERIRLADGWSKSTGYHAADYFDTMTDLRRMVAQFEAVTAELAEARKALTAFVRGVEVGEIVSWGGNGYEKEPLRMAKAALLSSQSEGGENAR